MVALKSLQLDIYVSLNPEKGIIYTATVWYAVATIKTQRSLFWRQDTKIFKCISFVRI